MSEIKLGQNLIHSRNISNQLDAKQNVLSKSDTSNKTTQSQLSNLIGRVHHIEADTLHLERISEIKQQIENNDYQFDVDQLLEQLVLDVSGEVHDR